MKVLADIEKEVMELSSGDQIALYDRLSLALNPPLVISDQKALEEAGRRSAEMDSIPSSRMSFEELKQKMDWE